MHDATLAPAKERDPPFFFMKPASAVVDATQPAGVPYPPKTSNYHHEIEPAVAAGLGEIAVRVS